jgi:YD repeat-containing protein
VTIPPYLSNLTSTYTYDPANNHLATVDGMAYSYDNSGNLLNNLWSYDVRGRLASATLPSGVVYNYGINGLGQRVSKTSTALSTGGRIYVYDEAGHLIGEYNNAGARLFEHVYLGDFPVAVITSTGIDFFGAADRQGNFTEQQFRAISMAAVQDAAQLEAVKILCLHALAKE